MKAADNKEFTDWNTWSPARVWRDWMIKSEASWSDAVSQLLKHEPTGEALNQQLAEMQLMHRQFSELAQASLAAANLPSRNDLEALDERMGRLEDGLAQVAAALSQLKLALAVVPSTAATATGKPSRTRRPARTAAGTQG